MSKRLMTLNLTDREMAVLEEVASKKGLNKSMVLRQALRLYQAVHERIDRGDKLHFENDLTKEKSELMVL